MAGGGGMKVERLPQEEGSYIDHVRWLSSSSFIIAASSNSNYYLQTLSLNPSNTNTPTTTKVQSTWTSPSRITSLSVSPSLIAVSTSSGSLHLIPTNKDHSQTLSYSNIHISPVSSIDLLHHTNSSSSASCLSVGVDGRINLVSLEDESVRKVWDSDGLVGYNSVRWASPTEFVTGGFGFGLHWWDLRNPRAGPVALFQPSSSSSSSWPHRAASGIVHSIDIHTSRKHTCLAGGSAGTVFAWDLRWQHQPIILSGVGLVEKTTQSPSESEVWKVQYDNYTSSLDMGNISSSRILPAMICSEDGILAVVEEGEEPCELLAEPCAINSFDINQENPSDVICSLEWESIAVVTRQ